MTILEHNKIGSPLYCNLRALALNLLVSWYLVTFHVYHNDQWLNYQYQRFRYPTTPQKNTQNILNISIWQQPCEAIQWLAWIFDGSDWSSRCVPRRRVCCALLCTRTPCDWWRPQTHSYWPRGAEQTPHRYRCVKRGLSSRSLKVSSWHDDDHIYMCHIFHVYITSILYITYIKNVIHDDDDHHLYLLWK